jgi:mono/diheme cytochrome c family protein
MDSRRYKGGDRLVGNASAACSKESCSKECGVRLAALLLMALGASVAAQAHDVITTKVTFDREIIRLLNAHCISCHREGGMAFSLTTYSEARPWAKAIGEEVLTRRMPPWGAVKGFGDFRNDQGLTAEQLELIVDWEEGGAPEGDEKDIPAAPKFPAVSAPERPTNEIVVSGDFKLKKSMILGGLWPVMVPDDARFQITAELPDGSIESLLWLQNYKKQFGHPFLLRTPLELPTGTMIRGIPSGSSVALLPESSVPVSQPQTGRLIPPGQQ